MFAADGGGWVVAEVKRSGNTHFEMQLRAAARSCVGSTRPPQLKHKSVSPTEEMERRASVGGTTEVHEIEVEAVLEIVLLGR